MLFPLSVFILQIIFGLCIFDFFDHKKRFFWFERLIGSVLCGLVLGNFLILILAILIKNLYQAIFLALFIYISVSLIAVLIYRKSLASKLEKFPSNIEEFALRLRHQSWKRFPKTCLPLLMLFLIAGGYAYYLSIILHEGTQGEIRSTMPGWGDNAFHLDIINRLATVNPFDLEHPLLGGANLTYPFLIDFISALFLKLEAPVLLAYRLPLFAFGLSVLLLLFSLSRRILHSNGFAVLALILILLGSGLGFTVLWQDLKVSYSEGGLANVWQAVKDPPHEYTHLDNRTGGKGKENQETPDNIVWIVPVVSFLAHQRSFAVGLGLFVLILLAVLVYGKDASFWRFGPIAGIMPLSHTHSFLALFFVLTVLFWFHLKNWRAWLGFALLTSILALPQITYLTTGKNLLLEGDFIRPWFGWMTCVHSTSWFRCDEVPGTDTNVFAFWSKNFGVIFWLWLFSLLLYPIFIVIPRLRLKSFHLLYFKNFRVPFLTASVILFTLPNLFLFQPWDFDNAKLFFLWWIIAVIFIVAPLLQNLWDQNAIGKILTLAFISLAIAAGGFDFTNRLLTDKSKSFGYSDAAADNLELAEWIRVNTNPNDRFLTEPSIDPIPLFLAGRPVYMGYDGWLWSHGLDYSENRKNMETILSGDLEIACRENISFILLNDNLEKTFPAMNKNLLLTKTRVAFTQKTPFEERYILKILCP